MTPRALRTLRPVSLLCLLGALALPASAEAQAIYLDFSPAIEGEATAAGFEDWIEITSIGNDVTRADAAARPQFSLLHLTKRTDRSSPTLWRRSISGNLSAEARLVAVDADGDPVFEIVLEDVAIMSYSLGGTGGRGSEQLTLSFTRISFAYYPPDGGGTLVQCWDLQLNEGC